MASTHPHSVAITPQVQTHKLIAPVGQIGTALLAAVLAVLPDEYDDIAIRPGTYIDSEANIIYQQSIPGTGELIVFQEREGGQIGYLFPEGVVQAVADAWPAIMAP